MTQRFQRANKIIFIGYSFLFLLKFSTTLWSVLATFTWKLPRNIRDLMLLLLPSIAHGTLLWPRQDRWTQKFQGGGHSPPPPPPILGPFFVKWPFLAPFIFWPSAVPARCSYYPFNAKHWFLPLFMQYGLIKLKYCKKATKGTAA